MAMKYPIRQSLQQMCTLAGASPERVVRRVGLSASLLDDDKLSVSAETFLQLWDAFIAEVHAPGIELRLAKHYAHGPFLPPIFAFSCAETLALGLARLSDFKPLIEPLQMRATRPQGNLHVQIQVSEPGLAIPASMGLFELLYITECARCFTGTHVVPLATSLPARIPVDSACTDFLEHVPSVTGALSLTFKQDDADRPLITRSQSLWDTLEPRFQEQLDEQLGTATMAGRVKKTLTEALPGGSNTIEDMAKRLNVSKRSLQRRLSEEGTTFQLLLTETRFEMSERYLKDSGLSVPEISYLLGFRDTSSFFRAFHGWTGMTPGDFRASTTSTPQGTSLH